MSNSFAFFQALDNGNLQDVNRLLDEDPSLIGEKDDDDRMALHFAAEVADEETFKRILDMAHTTIDVQDINGFTPLTIAVMNGKLEFIELLIDGHAQVNQVDKEKHSLVHWAVVSGQYEALQVLIKHQAVVSLPDIYGAHPLHYATVLEDVPIQRAQAILHLLLKSGAPVECMDVDGRTPILWAASNGNVEAFKSLVQAGGNRLALDRDRLGVLHCAASHGHAEIIRAMLEISSGNVVNVKDRNGDTPLFFAATYGHYECAKLLLDNLADPNHLDHKLRTPAHCAAAKGQLRILKLLKQYGASFEFQNYRGDLPFHEACHTGSKELIEWLISFQPNAVNATNFHGRAPLHLAAATGDMELVILLCSKGAEVNSLMLYKNELFTARDVAERRGHEIIVEYLTQRYDAQKAADISDDHRRLSKTNIEEALRIARLNQAVASVDSHEILDDRWHNDKGFRRGKSMINGGRKDMINAGVNTSRRSSSASAIRVRLPKSTSTTDLMTGQDKENMDSSEVKTHHEKIIGSPEKKLVEETIQKLVQEELKRASELEKKKKRSKNEVRSASHGSKLNSREGVKTAKNGNVEFYEDIPSELDELEDLEEMPNSEVTNGQDGSNMIQKMASEVTKITKIRKIRATQGQGHGSAQVQKTHHPLHRSQASKKLLHTGNTVDIVENGEESSGSSTRGDPHKPDHKKHLRSTSAKFTKKARVSIEESKDKRRLTMTEDQKANQEVLKAILNRTGEQDLLHRIKHARSVEEDDDEDNIDDLVDGRAYIHEKAIFQELTHLKRMQIQYGKVQEKILVRSLIQNFCKMHGLNPKHFRYETFYAWEKFLYSLLSDQLKLIYLEERDRIQKISSRYPINRFESRLHKTMPLNDRIRELTRIYNGSTSVVGRTNGIKKYRPVTDLSCEGEGKRCECLKKHILIE